MIISKIRIFADIGRAQGIAVTASVAICGALSSSAVVQWYHIVYFTLIACFLHTTLNTYIAKNDVKLDAYTYLPERNPIISGELSEREALRYVWCGSAVGFLLIILFFFIPNYNYPFIIPTLITALLAFFWLIWYGWKGKFYLFSYDLSFSASYSFCVLFGVFAVGGMPTIYTWLFIGVTIFATTAFAQWENGLKDVEADRKAGVKSFAVVLGVRGCERLGQHYLGYGIGLKSLFLLFCFLAFLECKDYRYLIFLLIYAIPSQTFILYSFATLSKPIEHRKTILLDVTLTGILVYSVIYGKVGITWIGFLIIYLILGYLIGSLVQKKCEFKFRRFYIPK
ncbi:MAG: UbiA family prenyltransferase [Candidatus Thermoplasmatota archaeon]|nr:UbiA family prenyltransferase [Candidatus Thermoplasmatota archaeon]